MNKVDEARSGTPLRDAIVAASRWATFACIAVMTVLMVFEVIMRYFAGAPLGWNISLIQNVLMPGLLFLGLPWGYATGAHVSADLVYDRLPLAAQKFARGFAAVAVVVGLAGLVVGGYLAVSEAYIFGDAPPPLSARVPLPAWTWKLFMPIGAAATLVIIFLDLLTKPRRI